MEHRASFDKSAVNLFAIMAMSCIWKMRSFHKTPDDDLLIVRFRFTSSLSPVQSGSSRYRLWYRNECVCARFFKNGEKNEGKKENFRWIYWTTIELVLSCGRQTSSNVLAGCAFHWMRPEQRMRVCFQNENHTLYLFWILCVLTFIHRIHEHTHTHLQHNFIGNEIKCCCWVLLFSPVRKHVARTFKCSTISLVRSPCQTYFRSEYNKSILKCNGSIVTNHIE